MNCRDIRSLLDDPDGPGLRPAAAAHLAGCAACQAAERSFARLDALLRSEPAPPAPLDLTRAIFAAVAVRRAADLAWARRQLLTLVAAALLLVAGLGASFGWSSPDAGALRASARTDLEASLSIATDAWSSLAAVLSRGLESGAAALPGGPPLTLLLVLGPALLLLDGLVCRGWHRRPGGAT